MKYGIVIPDGAGDLPQVSLNGQTPLELAHCPALDRVAREGRLGTTCNTPEDLPAGSDVAVLSVLGYDPHRVYTGRASLEALAGDLVLGEGDVAFRCNLVTVADGRMVDYSAGGVSSEEGRGLLDAVAAALADREWEFHHGVGYRHLVIHRGSGYEDLETTPPHDILGEPVEKHLPRGKGADQLVSMMASSRSLLADHEINRVRRDLGERTATQIWLWGQGTRPTLTPFRDRYGLRGGAITAVDLVRGIAKGIDWKVIDVPGATGYLDTNYKGKGEAAIAALDDLDIVLVHVEAPDECGHEGTATAKIKAIEAVDRHVVGPLLHHMETAYDGWRLMVLPDHLTPLNVRTHTREPVPVGIVGTGMEPMSPGPYTEKHAARTGFRVEVGHELMEYFLRE